MTEQTEQKTGVYIDFDTKTAVLMGNKAVDVILDCLETINPETIVAAANSVLKYYFPEYDRGDEVWSLGSDETTVEYFKQRLGDGIVVDEVREAQPE